MIDTRRRAEMYDPDPGPDADVHCYLYLNAETGQEALYYVPVRCEPCMDCNAQGKIIVHGEHDKEDEICTNCNGEGYLRVEHDEERLTREQYEAHLRQRHCLYARYRSYQPFSIRNYWTGLDGWIAVDPALAAYLLAVAD